MNRIDNPYNATLMSDRIKQKSPVPQTEHTETTWKDISKVCCYIGGTAITVAAGALYFFHHLAIPRESSIAQSPPRALDIVEHFSDHSLMNLDQTVSDVALLTMHGLSTVGLLGVVFRVGKIEQSLAAQPFEMNIDQLIQDASSDKQLDICEMAPQMNPELTSFLRTYKSEIKQIYHELEDALKQVSINTVFDELSFLLKKISVGNWEILSMGFSKIVMIHPKLKKYIIKFSIQDRPVRDSLFEPDSILKDLRLHFNKLQQIRRLIEEDQYKHIVVPEAFLVETSKGPFVIEEKFHFLDRLEETDTTTEAKEELADICFKADLCDVYIENQHNCGWVKKSNSESAKIAIIDFDCEMVYRDAPQCDLVGTSFV
ncbi:MAG: hypothetical protein Q8L98_06955 [Chlamydiales bacterium]|nr:hypothetical protein [Chlamydiales bacterium]